MCASEDGRTLVYGAYYASDELKFWKSLDSGLGPRQTYLHVNRITGRYVYEESGGPDDVGKCHRAD